MADQRAVDSPTMDYLVCANCYCAYHRFSELFSPCECCGAPIVKPTIQRSLDQHYALYRRGIYNSVSGNVNERTMH